MTKVQELQIKQSEIRERLNELLAVETRTAEQNTELATATTEIQALEPELRAAILAQPDPPAVHVGGEHVDPETRERLDLRGRATLGAFLGAALSGRLPGGAEAEYGAACGADAGRVPLDLFEQDRPAAPETRAVTSAPATGTGVTVAPVQPFVFAPEHRPAAWHRHAQSVPSGSYSEMTISTGLVGQSRAEGR